MRVSPLLGMSPSILSALAVAAALHCYAGVVRPRFTALQRLNDFQALAEPLEMDDFTLTQEVERP